MDIYEKQKDLNFDPYNLQVVQELGESDLLATEMCHEFLTCVDEDEGHILLMRDDTHLHTTGSMNNKTSAVRW